jgi:tetratricopeptide (TPR) repeat protein
MPRISAKAGFLLLCTLAVTATSCVTANSAARSDIDPPASKRLIAFDASGAMIIAAETAKARAIHTFALPNGPERVLFGIDGTLSDARVHALIREHGWRRPETWRDEADLGLTFSIDPTLGDRRALHVHARSGATSIELVRIPIAGEVKIAPTVSSIDRRHLIVPLFTHGQHSLHVLDAAAARSALLNKAALDFYAQGDRAQAAMLLERAVEADPRAGDAIYNLACVHALMGDLERAADELAIAVAIQPSRYRRLAKKDPDLAPLRNLPSIQVILGPNLDTASH